MSFDRKATFGVFELDLASGELRKSGVKVRLQEQPFQVLKALLERPGEVVSREELQQRLWPDDTFVDFEGGLSTAVQKIRQALGDSSSNPRFVETLPKRGYRFVAPVEAPYRKDEPRPRGLSPALQLALAAAAVVAVGLAVFRTNDVVEHPPPEPLWTPIPLTAYPGRERTPDFSPDGSQIVFCWTGGEGGDLDVYVKSLAQGEPVQLTDNASDDFAPVWSPDGQWIAFSRLVVASSRADLVVIPALGGRERKILDYGLSSDLLWRYAVWTPDSRWLIITTRARFGSTSGGAGSSEGGRRGGLSLVSIETGELRPLTGTAEPPERQFSDLMPSVSPDGRWVAFCRFVSGSASILKIGLTPDPGPEGVEIEVTPGTGALTLAPTWSPDGADIIFYRAWEGVYASDGLWRVPAAGEAPPRPLNLSGFHPVVSPRSKRLAYQSLRTDPNIWRIPLSGPSKAAGDAERLLDSTRGEAWPTYSPDGSKIAFRSDRGGTPEIWVANADGSSPAPLTSMGAGATGNPRWSPDGRRVAFASMASGNREIYVIDADGSPGPVQLLSDHPADELLPSWSADGGWIYYTSNRSGQSEVWKSPADGGDAVQVTAEGGSAAYESSDGRRLYFVRDNELWKMPAAGGPATHVLKGVTTHHWTLLDGGFYYVPIERENEIRYFDFATGKHGLIVEMSGNVGQPWPSPDGRWLAFVMTEQVGSDLALVENFE